MHLRPLLLALFAASLVCASTEEAARKVLASRCWACHVQVASGGLKLDSRDAIIKGGKSGAAIVAGNAAASRLYAAVARTDPRVKPMPPGAPLPADELVAIKNWIDGGAPWTESAVHWSFQPLKHSSESIDASIARALAAKGLAPNPHADKRTLIRRLYFDIVGLPPTQAEFAAAFADERPDWSARLASTLLDSPQFGVKWGRHWLDVARYGEDDFSGTAVIPYPNAWRYRDWVVAALNADMPYDRFLKAQLAGDLMNDPALLPATGLIGLGPWYYGIAQPAQSRADERHDRVDMVTRGMLGVTVACARCHDHKYDPFTQRDYYALAGVFASTAYHEYPLVPQTEAQQWKDRKAAVDAAEKALKSFVNQQATAIGESFTPRIADYMMATTTATPPAGLNPKILERWKRYLAKPEESHPYLKSWFAGPQTREKAEAFQTLVTGIVGEKKAIDEENQRLVEAAGKSAPKVTRSIVLPGGYRSEEDFNPGAYIPSRSLDRDRFVAYNRTFGEDNAPLKFNQDLAAELMPPSDHAEYEHRKQVFEDLKKALPPQYAYLNGAAEFEPEDLRLNLRGNPESLGDVVPRRFPLVLSSGRTISFDQGSGRLQLADSVAHHPLAARVAVNRIWMSLFGQGLVRTPSNFGKVGDRPALPETLELLAAHFVEHGYSVKAIIREIVSSEAYQRASTANLANDKLDPDNRYLWRQNRRRLDAELLRDALLSVSGELDHTIGGESKPLDASFHRRTLYAKTSRFQPDDTLSLFDLPSASVTCEQRVVTNVPLQKLFFLNSDVIAARAAAVGRQLKPGSPSDIVVQAYALLLQRKPTEREIELGVAFLRSADNDSVTKYAQVLLASNEFAYVD